MPVFCKPSPPCKPIVPAFCEPSPPCKPIVPAFCEPSPPVPAEPLSSRRAAHVVSPMWPTR
eukprot:7509302-Alexandrium_andersonii.AAC.1